MTHKDPFVLDASLNIKRNMDKRVRSIDSFALQNEPKASQTMRHPVLQRRLIRISIACFIILFGLLLRLFTLQSDAQSYVDLADDNRIRILSEQAPRGIIMDRNGFPLTKNSPDVGIFIDADEFPEEAVEQKRIIDSIALLTNASSDELMVRLNELLSIPTIEPLSLLEHITHDQAIQLSIHARELPGVMIEPKILREYTHGEAIGPIVGYTGKITETEWSTLKDNPRYTLRDWIGKSGIEQSYESNLKGENGKKRVEVDAFGHVSDIVASEEAKAGANIILTIDVELQEKIYESLGKAVTGANSTGGSAVAINPQNGDVLALVSWPSYNPNLFSKGITQEDYQKLLNDEQKPLFNRSITGEYPSGSTIKPLIASAALQEGIITQNTTIQSVGGIQVSQWSFPDWKAGGHGTTNVTKAIAESVNTFFYAIGGGYGTIQGLGVDRIRNYAELYGLNQTLGIDIQGEATGFLPTKEWKEETKGEPWYIGDTYHLAIGQGDLLVTPLQVSSYVATIANGGTVYQPRLVKKIGDEPEIAPKVIRQGIISSQNLNIVKKGMRETVLSGSARSLQSLPITVAGKTGTAQFGNEGKNHAWFTSFAPYEKPLIALTILIEGGGEGSTTATPVARDILSWWAENRQ